MDSCSRCIFFPVGPMSLYHAKHAKSDDHDDPSATLLAVALIRSREAIVGTEVLTATASSVAE
ncbi:hypothetical protein D3P06_09470, partial [Paracoccus aestuarii]